MKKLIQGYEERFGRAAIYIAFVFVSLLAAVVLFGFLDSTGILEVAFGQHVKQANFGGAASIFLALVIFLITRLDKQDAKTRTIRGNVYDDKGKAIDNAEIHIDGINGSVRTNHSGLFEFPVPPLPQYVVHVTYGDLTAEHTLAANQINTPIRLNLKKKKRQN
jgi:hypothetical protein